MILRIESGDQSVQGSRWGQAVHISAGWDPFDLVDRAVAAAAFLSGGAKPRAEKRLPPSLDVFGWCTWDAFYSKISGRGEALLLALHTLYCLMFPECLSMASANRVHEQNLYKHDNKFLLPSLKL